jgi:hypothetical protein
MDIAELGRLLPDYGGVTQCAASICQSPELNEEIGAYLYKDLESGKLCVFCGNCARHVELNHSERFILFPA